MSSILIVDDEEDIRNFLTLVLESEGFSVQSAPGGVEALHLIQKEKPQVILLDLMMPQITGQELCRIIKKDPNFFDINIIILSARSDTATKVACFESGADEYLVKPIEAKELVARLKSFFRLIRGGPAKPFLDTSTKEMKLPQSYSIKPETMSLPRIKPRYGKYLVDSLIGSGATGLVLKGYDEEHKRDVAIKVLSRKLTNSAIWIERLKNDVALLASFEHSGIAGIYSFGQEENDYYVAMPWCPGGSIQDMIRRRGRVELLTALDIMLQCLDALDAALEKGIVHRDIKPSNLMLDQNQRIRIVDFGLAASDESQAQAANPFGAFGAPDYMAPEQAQFGKVDHRADIYSLGIILYQLLYGKQPFTSRSPIEMVIKHATEPFPEFDSLEGAVPREAYEIIEKMTQKAPGDRYQDYTSCRSDLVSLREEIYSSTGVLLPEVYNLAPSPIWKTKDYFEILSALYVSPHEGVLTVQSGDRIMQLLVENRYILFQQTADAEDTIWRLLTEAGFIKQEEAPASGSDFRQHLLRFLTHKSFGLEDLKKVYRQHLKSVVLNAGKWQPVECEFHAGEVHNDDIEGLFIGDALLDLARSVVELEDIQSFLHENRYLTRVPDSDHILTALSLTPEESFIASRIEFNQSIKLQELCLMTGLPEEKIMRLTYVMLRIGVIQWKTAPERQTAAEKTEQAEADLYGRIAEKFFQLARREFELGNYWKVTELCKQAVRNNATQGKHYHLMAMAYAHHPRFIDDAEQCFNKAIELEPEEPEYRLSLARFLIKRGNKERAGSEIKRVLEIDPENPDVEMLQQEISE